ncbi:ribosomal protein L40E [Methanolinea mesophila]|uniref:zinc ribbon domain-containing protein n=1 Tax=Methanolinea mesophila TaxID=547055 RepID=UPI001AE8EC2E|nr:zinc ribbon domain-containing protein [Methanolinea mesophila]MBP1929893.1 ribosomal protein L40E [Methanolinea mesophila]
MNGSEHRTGDPDPEEELTGPERYLQPGEELLIWTPDIQIKKFRFEAYLTDRRLFLVDQSDAKPGVTAKEIPVDSIIDGYLEISPAREPVLVLSIRTSDDDVRTMKMTFVHTGEDRNTQVEEWVHLIQHHPQTGTTGGPKSAAPATAPEARSLSETIIVSPIWTPPAQPRDEPAAPQREPERNAPPEPPVRQTPSPVPPAAPRNYQAPSPPSQTQILFCHHCGKRIPPNANFCPYCGTRMLHTGQNNIQSAPAPKTQDPTPAAPVKSPPPAPEPEKTQQKKKGFFRR